MNEIFTEQWLVIIWAVLAITFNIYKMGADGGRYTMGSVIRKYGVYLEFVNWFVLLGVIIYLSYLYTWWFLFAFWIFPVVGLIISSILGSSTQLVYIFAMPIFTILGIIHLIQR
jgi:hypothetical protein